jgi:diaminopimelate epimerase
VDADEVAVTVDMGAARFDGTLEVPEKRGPARVLERVDMGNPHAITFSPEQAADFDLWAPRAALLPAAGTNVELAQVRQDDRGAYLEVVVWERGVGRTLACGTGACASAALACRQGLLPYDQQLRVRLPGGELLVTVRATDHRISMSGPARRSFRGSWPLHDPG